MLSGSQDCLDLIFEFWSPSKEIRHQREQYRAFTNILAYQYDMSRRVKKEYLRDVRMLKPDLYNNFMNKMVYQQYIRCFPCLRLTMSWTDALKIVKRQKLWILNNKSQFCVK